MKLYDYWRSSCSWRVRWALFYKNLEFEVESIPLLEKKQYSDSHLARNPRGKVPALEFQKSNQTIVLNESLPIIEWLEEMYPSPALLPELAIDRARVRELAEYINSWIHPLQNLATLTFYSDDVEKRKDWARHWILDGLRAYEKRVSQTAGEFSFGDDLTLADLCLIPQVYNAKRFGLSLEGLPHILKINDNALATESCQKAHPENFKPQDFK